MGNLESAPNTIGQFSSAYEKVITATNNSPEFIPNTALATVISSSKLLPAAVNDIVAFLE